MFDGSTLGNIEMSQHNGMNSFKVDYYSFISSSIDRVDSHCHCSHACRAQDGSTGHNTA